MKDQRSANIIKISFYDFYETAYAPCLKNIDLLLKTMEMPLSVEETAEALCMSEDAIHSIMEKNSIIAIDRLAVPAIMAHGESAICRLYQREIACGSPSLYNAVDVAYIYGLENTTVAVSPPSEEVTDWIWLYPAVPAGWKAAPPTSLYFGSPDWACQL